MKNTLRLSLAAALLAALALLVSACGSDDSGSASSEADSGEKLTIYSGREEELVAPVYEDYGNVEVRYGDSAPLAATILEEGENSPADLFFSQDGGALGALAAEGLLEPLPERILDQVPPAFRATDDTWVGITGRARIIAYGPEVAEDELPDSPLELTAPEWEGRVGWAPTNASLQSYVTALRVIEGEEIAGRWLEWMAENAEPYEKNSTVRDAIAAGEIDLGLVNHYYVAQAAAEQGPDYPVKIHYPPAGLGSLINVAGIGVLASSDNKEGALEFVEYLLSEETQTFFVEQSKEYPLVDGVEADPDLVPLDQIPAPEIDLAQIADLEATLELMRETGAL